MALLTIVLGACTATSPTPPAGPPPNDLLNAVLWMQRSVEYKGNATGAYALARLRLDEALADRSWTAAPAEQTGSFQNLPPAVVLDVDETVLDNSAFQVWMLLNDKTYDDAAWHQFVASQMSTAIPGAVEFTQYADAKGVKVFYVTNRTAVDKEPTRQLMARLGFPMGGNVDTFLMQGEKPEWGSAKGTRRAVIAKDYRVLLCLGDNFGDFVDAYKGSEADRLKVYEDNKARWGRSWIVIANPSYGSFEAAPFLGDYKKPVAEQRQAKRDVLTAWPGPK
jgi:acid phosphatase